VKLSSLRVVVVLLIAGAFAACGTTGAQPFNNGPPPRDSGIGTGVDGAPLPIDGGPPINLFGDSGTPIESLAIAPLTPVLTVVTGTPVPTQQFTASENGKPATSGVSWSIDQGQLGTVDSTGLFTPSGTAGGVGNITATTQGLTATTTITVNLQTTDLGDPGFTSTPTDAGTGGYGGVGGNGPGAPPSSGQTGTLNGTPTADTTVHVLYPYDGTVWPQGLLAPLLQWDPGTHAFDSVYVHITEANFEYKGYFASNTTGAFINVPIPQQAWSDLAYSNSGEPVNVSLVFAQGANAYGPYTETWTIAQATLQGTIYYNSYGTALVQNSDGNDSYGFQYGAGTLATNPGATAPTLVAGVNGPESGTTGGGCRVCHTVAANGQSLVTQASTPTPINYAETVTINLANDTTGGAGTATATPNLTYPALYKDGSLALSSNGGISYPGSTVQPSLLYSLPAGTPVTGVTGLPSNFEATLPSFSPDGAHVSFNFWTGTFTTGGGTISGDAISLAMLDFDGTSAFSNPRILYTPAAGTAVTYSSFFPNAAGVVFEVELSNPTGDFGYTWSNNNPVGNTGELWWIDVATKTPTRLDKLNGRGPSGTITLPAQPGGATVHTPAQDVTLNYEPTVNPIASGGYAWVVFTSRRMYGNVAQLGPWVSDPRGYPWKDQITDKKLWVAAVDLNAPAGTDPSHPAFYLPAQEIHAGNSRGYWTVEPCKANGQSCITGDQCCAGYCEPVPDAGLECTMQAPVCSGEYDKCTTTSDCCASPGIQCINGVCTLSSPK
jgi:hypothetical protein